MSLSVGTPVMSVSSKTTLPCFGVSKPNIVFMRVDLPQPLGPNMVTASPGSMRIETPCRISVSPYPATMLSTVRMLMRSPRR